MNVAAYDGTITLSTYPINDSTGAIDQTAASQASFALPSADSTYAGPFFSAQRDIVYLPLSTPTRGTVVYALTVDPSTGTLQSVTGSPYVYANGTLGNPITRLSPNEDFFYTFASADANGSVPMQVIAIAPDGSLAPNPVDALVLPQTTGSNAEYATVLFGPLGLNVLYAGYTDVTNGLVSTSVAQFTHDASGVLQEQASFDATPGGAAGGKSGSGNLSQSVPLIETNLLGQNSPVMAQTASLYAEMWAQDAVALFGYTPISSTDLAFYPTDVSGSIEPTPPKFASLPDLRAGDTSTPLVFSQDGSLAYSFVTPAGSTTAQLRGWMVNRTVFSMTPLPGSPYLNLDVAGNHPFLSLLFDPTGERLFVSVVEAGNSTLTCYDVGPDGALRQPYLAQESTRGETSLQEPGWTGVITPQPSASVLAARSGRFMTDPLAMRAMAGRFDLHRQFVEDELQKFNELTFNFVFDRPNVAPQGSINHQFGDVDAHGALIRAQEASLEAEHQAIIRDVLAAGEFWGGARSVACQDYIDRLGQNFQVIYDVANRLESGYTDRRPAQVSQAFNNIISALVGVRDGLVRDADNYEQQEQASQPIR